METTPACTTTTGRRREEHTSAAACAQKENDAADADDPQAISGPRPHASRQVFLGKRGSVVAN